MLATESGALGTLDVLLTQRTVPEGERGRERERESKRNGERKGEKREEVCREVQSGGNQVCQ